MFDKAQTRPVPGRVSTELQVAAEAVIADATAGRDK